MRRIALVGLGAAARHIHLPAYAGLRGARVVAGCDSAASTQHFDFPLHDSLERMLDQERVDIVVIATPTESHFPLARLCLERGIHVLCEKPFADTVAQAAELVRMADARGVRIAVNNEFRFMRCHAAAKREIGTAGFGDLRFLNMHQTFRASAQTEAGWRGDDPERTCKEFGTHVFDLCRFFYGEEPITLHCRMPRPDGGSGPDMLNLIDLEFPGDRWARITLDRLTRGRHRYLDVRLDGSHASIETELGGHLALGIGVNASSRRPFVDFDLSMGGRAFRYDGERKRKLAADPLDLFAAATRALMQQFLAALDAGVAPPCEGRDNLRTLALMRAAYEAASGNGTIDLAFLRDLP
ncbi:MAG: Gfo/Idh/MocA family oxidoreductase [Caldimonas sp.]